MQMPLRECIRLVAPRINAQQEYDIERMIDTIYLALCLAWNSGKWWQSMDRLIVQVVEQRLVLPAKYGVLWAINYNNVPRMIHNIWYTFSPNGPGSSNTCWDYTGIFDLQTVPTQYRIRQGEHVIAISKSKIGEDLGTAIVIQGQNSDGNEIYRYNNITECTTPIRTSNSGEEIRVAAYQENGQYSPAYATQQDFAWDGITAILKPQTIGPIEIYATAPRGARKLVTMAPGDTTSELRAYHIPPSCVCGPYVEVLAKKREPQRPYHMDEILTIPSPNALLDLCMSVYFNYDSSYDPQKAASYLTNGLAHLNGQLQENIGASQQRPQIWVGASYARHKRRQVNSY
jgi:hypothetical protein